MILAESKHQAIEQKRQEMMILAEVRGYTSPDTVKASQELDKLMNTLILDKQSLTFLFQK